MRQTGTGSQLPAKAYRRSWLPQVPADPDHFTDEDVQEGCGFDLERAGGIRRLVEVVGAEDEGLTRAVDSCEGTAVHPGQRALVGRKDMAGRRPASARHVLIDQRRYVPEKSGTVEQHE